MNLHCQFRIIKNIIYIYSYVYYQMKIKFKSFVSCARVSWASGNPTPDGIVGGRELHILVLFVPWNGRAFVWPDA